MREVAVWIALSYLLGSIPTGFLLVKYYKGIDIRNIGSGNLGANNVRRVMGKEWGIFVAIVDMTKGVIGLLGAMASGITTPWILSTIALAGVLGHNYPVWLNFRGGKGVSTSYGVIALLWPLYSFAIAMMGGVVWYAIMRTTRYASLASVLSLFTVPFFFLILRAPIAFTVFSLLLALLSTWRHHENLRRLINGTESQV
ncbi:MAG: glycerol-3-phosphate 1-O-acyltransferase PlsY [Synergistaceae bacterium]|nr:glycerol-3-phosphate 1-O-acyltransferase PlsY [Synergistaceae bacterium]